jgi:glutaredoxin|tara:strand:- start:1424 stop:1786 length:363 start_codon:yes stop_codon:yes gene_type:complete
MKILTIVLIIILNGTLIQCSSAPKKIPANEQIITQAIQKSIVVYGSHQCHHCVNLKAKLDSIGLEYTFHDVDISDQYALEMVAKVKASGHTQGFSIPVVVVNDQELFIAPHISKVVAALD